MRPRSALLFATFAALDGGPAAALAVSQTTLLGRLLDQLSTLGVRRTSVVTRPEWVAAIEMIAAGRHGQVRVVVSDDLEEDLRIAADIARRGDGRMLVGTADVLMHQRPLAVLLAEPRIRSGALVTVSRPRAPRALPVRTARGRIVSAGSAYHRVRRPNAYLLGFLVIDDRDRDGFAAAAAALAPHLEDPLPAGWDDELERKMETWRVVLLRARLQADGTDGEPIPTTLDAASEQEVETRAVVARGDVMALLTVALVRTGVSLTPSHLRRFFHARPLSQASAQAAAAELVGEDEDALALASAVKARDGFFTTFFVSPYSRYIARFAARRGWTPNALTTVSLGIGVLAAGAFALGSRTALVAGAVLLQVAFTMDCVDGQLARYTLTFSKLGAWLDSVFDRAKEYLVYAGLAIGASRGRHDDVWGLAAAALALQTLRHTVDFSFAASRNAAVAALPPLPLDRVEDSDAPAADAGAGGPRAPAPARDGGVATAGPATAAVAVPTPASVPVAPGRGSRAQAAVSAVGRLDRWKPLRWARRIFLLPIGERFALISLTAALATPRVTFTALLVWGGVVAVYSVSGRVLRSVAA